MIARIFNCKAGAMTNFPTVSVVVGNRNFTNEQLHEARAFAAANKLEVVRQHKDPGNCWEEFIDVEYAVAAYVKDAKGNETLTIDGPRGLFSLQARNTHNNAIPVAVSFRPVFFQEKHCGYQFSSLRYADGVTTWLGEVLFTFDQPALKALTAPSA